MSEALRISNVRFTRAPARLVVTGLIGWIRLRYGALLLDGLAVRRTQDGRAVLAFPSRKGRRGSRFPTIRPLNGSARDELTCTVLDALRREGVSL